MTLDQVRAFVAVAEELHFVRAAERLLVSQPALSQQVRAMERELGVTLLERDHRRVRLTAAGEVFLDQARRMLTLHENLRRDVLRAAGAEDRLRVAYVESSNLPFIARAVRAVREKYPLVRVEHLELYPARQAEALLERRVDVGIAMLPVGHAGLTSLPLLRTRWSVALPERHPLAGLEAVPLAALRDVDLVVAPDEVNPPLHRWLVERCRAAGFEPRVAFRTASTTSAAQLAREGVGVPVMCSSTALGAHLGLVVRPLDDEEADIEIGAVWRSDVRSPVVRAFVQAARAAATLA